MIVYRKNNWKNNSNSCAKLFFTLAKSLFTYINMINNNTHHAEMCKIIILYYLFEDSIFINFQQENSYFENIVTTFWVKTSCIYSS